ncbi:hypothetical protein JM83_1241 [Gillisia sp. Hel_I_86]|uniref:DUF6427 family protein n=1 Tax=Gillisia sp. Hel_I_86 TaxID=1249981 RepID=UPI00119A901F|nr:DUF6427 family protein [Gillisia sp. Hel_I_86]TVZ26287.1 hypothetical protein JM83_1241 [Gillisia sp. Hel_I_86]
MLTSFFSKSKPVIFLTVVIFMAVFYVSANVQALFQEFSTYLLFTKIGVLASFLVSVLILDFIAKKNELTKRSGFKILIFALCAVSFSGILKDNQVIVANLCVLLALRRIISLKSRKDVALKIFDATFWICIASLFYFWAILFLIIVYAGIIFHAVNYFKNWLIPIIGLLIVFVLVTTFHLVFHDDFYSWSAWFQESSFNFENYQNLSLLIPLSVLLAITFWTLSHYFKLFQKSGIRSRPTYMLVFITLLISLSIAIFSPVKDGSELLFFLVPLSIITSNYFENKKDRGFKETLLILLILMPILMPIFF